MTSFPVAQEPDSPMWPADKHIPDITRRNMMVLAALGVVVTYVGTSADSASAAVGFPLYNPYKGWALRDDWAKHRARGSAGGVDYGLPVGTNVLAPAGGVLTYSQTTGAAGWQVTIRHPDGHRSILMHLSGFVGGNRTAQMGEVIAKSGGVKGAPGAGSSSGAHLHWSLITPAGSNIDPLPQINSNAPTQQTVQGDNDMRIIRSTSGKIMFIGPKGLIHVQTPQHADLLTRVVNGTNLNFLDAEIDMLMIYMRP